MNSSRRLDSNNDFLETPHTNRQKLRQKEKVSEDIKAKYIEELEERNRKLKYQIIKINEMLDQQKQKPVKKQHKLIPTIATSEVAKKELENVYKQIKNYERDIHNLQTKQAGGLISDRMARLQNIYNEKTAHLEKLKNQLSKLTKTSLDNQKKLKNNAGKEQLQNQMLKYNEEIKLLREKVRETDQREKKKMENAKKQFDYIKKLERELIETGVSIEELQQMKKNNIYNQIYQKLANKDGPNQIDRSKSRLVKSEHKQEIEEITVDRYMQLKNEIKLHKKLRQDYEKRLDVLEKQKAHQEKLSQTVKDRIKQKDNQLEKLQEQIGDLKSKIKKPEKPAVKKEENKEKKKPKIQRILPPTKKPEQSPMKNSATDNTHLKYDQKGQLTERGSRFTDRTMLGKNFTAKIVSLKVWTQKSSFQITGIQCFYKVNDQIRPGTQHVLKQCKLQCTENVMQLPDGDFVKGISGNLSQNNIIEYLVVMSKECQIARFGVVKPTQKQFNFDIDEDQVPICLYGSLYIPQNKKDCSLVEQLGFQISRQKEEDSKGDKFI